MAEADITNPSRCAHSEPGTGLMVFLNIRLSLARNNVGPYIRPAFSHTGQGMEATVLRYSISDILWSHLLGQFFFSGLIFTKDKNLDRETKAEYKIVVEAQDAQGLQGESGTATVLITLEDINDNFPIFTQCKPLPSSLIRQGLGQSRFMTWGLSKKYPKPLYISPYPWVLLKPKYGDPIPSLIIALKVTHG